ncbi:DUF4156 domain-containing protein [Parasalinivibrio latis]|uniref:DUF4156 domain-containing protein n=1 Tax=Parasalinivibrio latis TaxID=2952610 RepID=UPI0030E1E61E
MSTRMILPLAALLLQGCVARIQPSGQEVTVLWGEPNRVAHCENRGTVVGSEGHWYDYWILSYDAMINGSLNQMKNEAGKRGADTVYLYDPMTFVSSVTFMANAYKCNSDNAQAVVTGLPEKTSVAEK